MTEKGRRAFSKKVIAVVSGIPRGKVMSYSSVAKAAGNRKAARAIAPILRKYYKECVTAGRPKIACHRVIRADGTLGGYIHGKKRKKALLKKEGAL